MRCKCGLLGANLTRPFNLSTALASQSRSVFQFAQGPAGLFFKSDGTRFYVCSPIDGGVGQYVLSTAWDISTATFSGSLDVSQELPGQGIFGGPLSVFIGNGGSSLYVSGDSDPSSLAEDGIVAQYSLGTAWDITSATLTRVQNINSEAGSPLVWFNPNGTIFFVCDKSDAYDLYSFALTTPWDISTLSIQRSASLSGNNSLCFSLDGSQMYKGTNHFYLSSAFDISTASLVSQSGGAVASPYGAYVSDDGLRIWITSAAEDAIKGYVLG